MRHAPPSPEPEGSPHPARSGPTTGAHRRSRAARVEALFGAVPREFLAVHRARLAHAAWRDACDALRDPVRVITTPTGRAVLLTRQALFTFGADGALGVTVIAAREDGVLQVAPLPPDEVSVAPLLPRWYWLGLRRKRLAAKTMQALREERRAACAESPREASGGEALATCDEEALRRLVDGWSGWVFTRIRRDLAARFDLSAIRARSADGLALDPEVLALARRLRRRQRSIATRTLVTLGDYEAARRHLATLRRLHAETPALLAPWSMVFAGDPADAAPPAGAAGALRAWVLAIGCSPRTWRLLATHGTRTLDALEDYYRRAPGADDPGGVLADALTLLDAFELRRMPPAWLLRALLGLFGNPNAPRAHYGYALRRDPNLPLLRQAFACLQRMPDWGASRGDAVQRVLEWAADASPIPALDAPRRRAGWAWLDAEACRWRDRRSAEARAEADGARWPVPLQATRIGPVDVVPIDDAFALWREGLQMRHCADTLRGRLAHGDHCVLLSLRKGPSRSDRATALLARDAHGRWRIEEVGGFANARAPAWAVRVARRVRATLGGPGR